MEEIKLSKVGLLLCWVLLSYSCNSSTENHPVSLNDTSSRQAQVETGINKNEPFEKAGPRRDTVIIRLMKFKPDVMQVNKGDTVVFINKDIVVHDITQEPDKTWTSSALPVGESWSMVATESANYFCSIHVTMKGKIIVN